MNKFFFLVLSVLILSVQAVTSQTKKNQLHAQIENVPDGTLVYFSILVNENEKISLDSTQVKNGKFQIELPAVDHQVFSLLSIAGVRGDVSFINENKSLTAKIYPDSIYSSVMQGSDANELLTDYKAYMKERNAELIRMSRQFSTEELEDPNIREELESQQMAIARAIVAHNKELIKTHPNALPSLFIFSDLIDLPTITFTEMFQLYGKFSTLLKETPMGKKLGEKYGESTGISIGDIAFNFSAKTPEGEELSLQDVMNKDGKYTLIEFWASWCSYCRAEMPNVVEVYKKYHEKGLNILSVSLDKEKSEWMDAIKKFGMNWDHVSILNGWDDPAVRLYQVSSIPMNYLLDEDGKVIEVKLKGADLEKKMQELLGDQ
ncbi:TlpA disulfide reductase family protein [Mesonia sp. MT50]|uniref:TlpA disulfide reductase family protein n=1 Tax=Mesonia profundi TaxID=3070998 RepID=A0ABU1A264_9FLAO|nr:TlpA disulfide reductase family protein [Mesonia profundi]MDQ7917792.1 TlpA disulfide reductase family protein [Mesonia profundi]